jgi:hypothetical protein
MLSSPDCMWAAHGEQRPELCLYKRQRRTRASGEGYRRHAPPFEAVPPAKDGGTERVVATLTDRVGGLLPSPGDVQAAHAIVQATGRSPTHSEDSNISGKQATRAAARSVRLGTSSMRGMGERERC